MGVSNQIPLAGIWKTWHKMSKFSPWMRPREHTGKINTCFSPHLFFLCKTFRLRSSLEINWHSFSRCSRAAVIYKEPVHFKSWQLWQREVISQTAVTPEGPRPSSPGPPGCFPWPHSKAVLGGGSLSSTAPRVSRAQACVEQSCGSVSAAGPPRPSRPGCLRSGAPGAHPALSYPWGRGARAALLPFSRTA